MKVDRLTDKEILHLGWTTLAQELGLSCTVRFAALAMTRGGAKKPAAKKVLGAVAATKPATRRRRATHEAAAEA